eukprot:COSAG01_NODE_53792_length_336_cov_1.523207_1_plen_47_part_10
MDLAILVPIEPRFALLPHVASVVGCIVTASVGLAVARAAARFRAICS